MKSRWVIIGALVALPFLLTITRPRLTQTVEEPKPQRPIQATSSSPSSAFSNNNGAEVISIPQHTAPAAMGIGKTSHWANQILGTNAQGDPILPEYWFADISIAAINLWEDMARTNSYMLKMDPKRRIFRTNIKWVNENVAPGYHGHAETGVVMKGVHDEATCPVR